MPVTLSSRTAAAASAAASSCRPAAMASAEMPVTTHRSSSPPCWYDSTCWGTALPTWNRVFPASERSNAKPWQQSRPPATMSRCSAWNARLASTRPKFRYHRTRFACFSSASASASWCRRPPAGAAAAPLAASSSTASSSGSSRRPHPLRPGHAVALRPGIAMAPRDRLHRAGTACRCPATSARLALLVLHGESESSAARADHRREEGGGGGGGQSDGLDHLPASWRPLRLEIIPGPAPLPPFRFHPVGEVAVWVRGFGPPHEPGEGGREATSQPLPGSVWPGS